MRYNVVLIVILCLIPAFFPESFDEKINSGLNLSFAGHEPMIGKAQHTTSASWQTADTVVQDVIDLNSYNLSLFSHRSPLPTDFPFSPNLYIGSQNPDLYPSIGIAPNGTTLYVFFEVEIAGKRLPGFTISYDRGKTWPVLMAISATYDARNPQLAVDPVTGYLWVAYEYPFFAVSLSENGGRTWTQIYMTAKSWYANCRYPSVTAYTIGTDNWAYIAIEDRSANVIRTVYSSDKGVHWSPDNYYVYIIGSPYNGRATVSMTFNYVYLSWEYLSSSGDYNVVCARDDGSYQWPAQYTFYTGPSNDTDERFPAITTYYAGTNLDYIYLAIQYRNRSTQNADIRGIVSTNTGASYTQTAPVAATSYNETYPHLTASQNNIQVVYFLNSSVYYANSTNYGASWLNQCRVSDTMNTAIETYRGVAIKTIFPNQPVVVWNDLRRGGMDIFFSKRDFTIAQNRPPNTPSAPGGPASGNTGVSYQFTAVTTDPDNDTIMYTFDWGDGSTTHTGYYVSGSRAVTTHTWSSTGNFQVKVQAQDNHGALSGWSPATTISITTGGGNNAPATPSSPTGTTTGYVNILYTYTTTTTDPENDQIKYIFDWGDGTSSETGYQPSATSGSLSHSWSLPNTYSVKVMAVDSKGAASSWSTALAVTITNPPATVNYTITREPLWGNVNIDGVSYPAPKVCQWIPGSTHTVSVEAVEFVSTEKRFAFQNWSDGGQRTHSFTVGTSDQVLTANFVVQWRPKVLLEGTASNHRVTVSYTLNNTATSYETHTRWENWVDEGTRLCFSTQTLDSGARERRHTAEDFAQFPWIAVSSGFSRTVTYYHQYKPEITLAGTSPARSVGVSYSSHGVTETEHNVSGSWSRWVDEGSKIVFDPDTVDSTSMERFHTYTNFSSSPWNPVRTAFFATVTYHHQFFVILTFRGLSSSAKTEIAAVQGGEIRYYSAWDVWSAWSDANTNLNLSSCVQVSDGERYATADITTFTVTSAFTQTITYFHQYRATIHVRGLDEKHKATLSYVALGIKNVKNISALWTGWADANSELAIHDTITVLEDKERYYSSNTSTWSLEKELTAVIVYHHQWKVTIILDGTSATNVVSARYVSAGLNRTEREVWGTWTKWVDHNSKLEFSARTADNKLLTHDRTNWTVTSPITATIRYVMEIGGEQMRIELLIAAGAILVAILTLLLLYLLVFRRARRPPAPPVQLNLPR